MSPKLIRDLEEKYPSLKIPCPETDNGWYDLIDMLLAEVTNTNNQLEKYKIRCSITQIKEKFGGLRFYVVNNWVEKTMDGDLLIEDQDKAADLIDKLYEFIERIEDTSRELCEICGVTGEILRSETQLKTLCKNCRGMKFQYN